MSGELVKLKIDAYKTGTYEKDDRMVPHTSEDYSFTALFNPTTFNQSIEIEYEDAQSKGSSGAEKKFAAIKPGDFSLELLVDGTGASSKKVNVKEQIDQFMKVCANFDGDSHSPNYLLISWAGVTMKTVLLNADIAYTMFDKNSNPLRAKITATFSETMHDVYRENKEKKNSPDLTHVRVVKEGDTLPLMSKRIYGNSKYYLQVAQANGLRKFRDLKPGTELYFPPIVKE